MLELILFGALTGFVSGYFGVGGGMVLVPMLLYYGFDMKQAVSISIMQMVFSSIYGSFLNSKKSISVFKDGILLGIGGFLGGLQSGFIVSNASTQFLEYLFLSLIIFAIIRVFISNVQIEQEQEQKSRFTLLLIGFIIGILAMSIGIGGSIMLTPVLLGFMKYNLKVATSLSLFFVVFSSVAGFISMSYNGQMLFAEGVTVGLASLVGVYFGTKLKHQTHIVSYKKFILILYVCILIAMINKILF